MINKLFHPLCVGTYGDNNFLSSLALSVASQTNNFYILKESDPVNVINIISVTEDKVERRNIFHSHSSFHIFITVDLRSFHANWKKFRVILSNGMEIR